MATATFTAKPSLRMVLAVVTAYVTRRPVQFSFKHVSIVTNLDDDDAPTQPDRIAA